LVSASTCLRSSARLGPRMVCASCGIVGAFAQPKEVQ
jgi:hypothetical protein